MSNMNLNTKNLKFHHIQSKLFWHKINFMITIMFYLSQKHIGMYILLIQSIKSVHLNEYFGHQKIT